MNTTSESKGMIIEPKRTSSSFSGIPNTSFFGILFNQKTYRSILYLFLLFPVSIVLLVYSVTMGSLSIGLGITVFGLPLAYIFLYSLPYVLEFQTSIAAVILDVPMPAVKFKSPSGKFFDRLFALFKDSKVQFGFLSTLLLFPIGIFTFVFTLTSLIVSLSLMSVILFPLVRSVLYSYGVEFDGEIYIRWLPEGIPEFAVLIPTSILGFFLLILSLHMIRGLALIHANILYKLAT